MKRTSPLLLVVVFFSAPATALPIFDASLSVGLNHARVDSLSAPEPNTLPEHFTGTEPRVTFNASVTSLLGVELGWSKFGSDASTMTIPPPGFGQPGVMDIHQSGSAFWIAYAPSLQLGAFDLTGKVGAARVKHEVTFDVNDFDDNDVEALFGVAATYWFGEVVGIRFDAERIGSDVAQIGLSLTIGF